MADSMFEDSMMVERDYQAEQAQQQILMPPGILGTRPGAIPHPMQSFILSDPVIDRLASALPPYPISGWRQLYSTEAHGFSLNTLYERADGSGASILAVLTMQGNVFGAFLADGIRKPQPNQFFYGEGESFLFSVDPTDVRQYAWTGDNFLFCFSAPTSISIGGGDGEAGLYLEDTLTCGSTGPCETFGNPVLCPNQCIDGERMDVMRSPTSMNAEEFEVAQVEVWGIDPTALKRARDQAATAASLPFKQFSRAPPFNANMSNMLLDGF